MEQGTTVVYWIKQDDSLYFLSLWGWFYFSRCNSSQLQCLVISTFLHSPHRKRVITGHPGALSLLGVFNPHLDRAGAKLGLDGCLERREMLKRQCSEKYSYLL